MHLGICQKEDRALTNQYVSILCAEREIFYLMVDWNGTCFIMS